MMRSTIFGEILCIVLVANTYQSYGITREYFVKISEIYWDYAPTQVNQMTGTPLQEDEDASVFTSQGDTTIGRVYKKAVYREYTDSSFTEEVERPKELGILGPPLKAEVDDVIMVHVKNEASRKYTVHPHGVFYNKSHEGALHRDETLLQQKLDDGIPPGESYTYQWDVNPSFAPTEDDPNCMSWGYHSHKDAAKDTNSGLIGPIVICKKGILNRDGSRKDGNKEMYIFVTVFDENESWYLEENVQEFCGDPDDVDTDNEDFQESNKMHGINGLMYGNLVIPPTCQGEKIAVHLLGLGTEVDLHSVRFHGQTLITHGHRQDTINVFPAVFTTALLEADNVGEFELACSVNDHITAGMLTKFRVEQCADFKNLTGLSGNIRNYFIGIKETHWNYGPKGVNGQSGRILTEEGSDSATFFEKGPDRIGGVYKKALFYEYESENFVNSKIKDPSRGLLGPLISAEVGDTVKVTLKNFARKRAYNIEPHGVFYDNPPQVEPNGTKVYTWTVPDQVAPTEKDPDCVLYIYTSSVDPVKDTNSGLVGPLLICKRGTLDLNLERRAYYILLTVFDENSSHYIDDNIAEYTTGEVDEEDPDFMESNLMHSMNGLMYGNLDMKFPLNVETDLHIMAIGTEVDMHSFYIEGMPLKFRNEYTNVLSVFPHTAASATVKPIQIMRGLMMCHVNDHINGGMRTLFEVVEEDGLSVKKNPEGVHRTYYIAVEEEVWDYWKAGMDVMDHDLSAFTAHEDGRLIGSKYWKALFHEYTDESFTIRKKKPNHLGILGPIISAEEGDTIKIFFKNMATRPYNMIPQGLVISEGVDADGPVSYAVPNETVSYKWTIPEGVVPEQSDQPACSVGMYVSATEKLVKDAYSGLVGPVRICRKGTMRGDGPMVGVDKEFILLFYVFDESSSYYLDKNIREFTGADPASFNKEDEEFLENNLLHSINGRVGYLEGLDMKEGDRVVWHLMGLGNEVDLHTVHFHAHAFKYRSDILTHSDVFNIFPGKVGSVAMDVNAVGTWLVHCHVNDHVSAGMNTVYKVKERACRIKNFGKRSLRAHCSFTSPHELEEILQGGVEKQDFCLTHGASDICQGNNQIPELSEVTKLIVSSTFPMDPELFKQLVQGFSNLVSVSARGVVISSLADGTFSTNTKIRKVVLSSKNGPY